MNLSAVIVRLRAQSTFFLTRFAGAAEFEAIDRDDMGVTLPFAWVVPTRDTSDKAEITEQFAVIAAILNTTDERGQAAADDLDPARQDLLDALLDWPPSSDHRNVQYEGSSILDMSRGTLWWVFEFSAARIIRAVISWTITVQVDVKPTSSAAIVLGEFDTILQANLAGGSATQLDSDIRDDFETLAFGETKYQLLGVVQGVNKAGSNDTLDKLTVELKVHRRLTAIETERAYTRAQMLDDLKTVLEPDFWRTTNVHEILDDPDLTFPGDVERIGG